MEIKEDSDVRQQKIASCAMDRIARRRSEMGARGNFMTLRYFTDSLKRTSPYKKNRNCARTFNLGGTIYGNQGVVIGRWHL